MPQINLRISAELLAAIEKRGTANGIPKATYAAQVLERWLADDQPPVSVDDAELREARALIDRMRDPKTRKSLLNQMRIHDAAR